MPRAAAREPAVILLSLALVVASVGTLVGGLATSSQPLVWTSLAAGLAAVALVAGSVAQRRTRLTGAGAPGSPTLPPSPAAASAAHPAPDSASGADPAPDSASGGPLPGVPVTGGVFPSDRVPAGPRPPVDAPEPWAVTTGEVLAADDAAVTEVGDTPGSADTPGDEELPPALTAPVDSRILDSAGPNSVAGGAGSQDRPEQLSGPSAEPPVEDVAVRDALRVAQLADLVTVRDGHPRYHRDGCPTLEGTADRTELPVSVARRSGFTPCGVCAPDRTLLDRARR